MRRLSYLIPEDCGGMTVGEYSRKHLELSAHFLTVQKKAEGGISVNGRPAFTSAALRAGDILEFTLPPESESYAPNDIKLEVLWETEDYLIINKPFGMPVYPTPGHDDGTLLNAYAAYFKDSDCPVFRPLYRLDKDTSGAVVLAKNLAGVYCRLKKYYYCVCEGGLCGSGVIDEPIGLAPGSKIKRECGHGERAVTCWEALGSADGHTLLRLRLLTGRTHQIRVHLSHMGHPVSGDDLYGGKRSVLGRQALHCGSVAVLSKALEIERTIRTPFPSDLADAFPWARKIYDSEED